MNKLLIVLIILILLSYLRYNLKYRDEYEIIQLTPSKLTYDILNEKNPIVVDSDVGDVQGFVSKAFKYTYLYDSKRTIDSIDDIIDNNAKFVVLHTKEDNAIEIMNPKYKKNNYKSVVVKIKRNQLLILPMYWRFKSSKSVECIFLHDIFSCLYQAFAI